jgi:arylsulfatase A-like enzyme
MFRFQHLDCGTAPHDFPVGHNGTLGMRNTLRITLALAVGLLVNLRPTAVFAQAKGRPNLIFLLTDDQRADTLGATGNRIIRTPHIDGLARRGVMFSNAFVTTAICMTSRASILTGQYAARHGDWDFSRSFTAEQLAATYPALLKQAGYYLGFIGKWGVGTAPPALFDYDRTFEGQGGYFVKREGQTIHLTRLMGDEAVEFLSGAPQDRPFCLSISFKAPHEQDSESVIQQPFLFDPAHASWYADVTIPPPKLAAPEYFERLPDFLKNSENRARWAARYWGPARYQECVKGYYRLISEVDDEVGRIVAELEKRNLADNTVIVYTSDHGAYLGEYGFSGKWYAHEVSIRVPMIVCDPRLPDARHGTRRSEMALNIDLAPTLLELAGLPAPARAQGQSLVPLVEGRQPAWRHEFFYEHHFKHPRIPDNEGLRTEQWKYLRFVDQQPVYEELYDLAADPLEEHNLAKEPASAATLAEMRTKWAQLREQSK